MNATIDIDFELIKREFNKSPNGCDCVFVPLNDKIAIKLYYEKITRDRAYNAQTEAAKIGLGPETYGFIDDCAITEEYYDDIDDEYYPSYNWGYLTEIVETVSDGFFEFKKTPEFYSILSRLEFEVGFNFTDNMWFNWGKKNGQFIPIDFAEEQ